MKRGEGRAGYVKKEGEESAGGMRVRKRGREGASQWREQHQGKRNRQSLITASVYSFAPPTASQHLPSPQEKRL